MRPIAHPAHQSVLDWVKVNVVDVSLEVGLVPDRMLPKARLPKRVFAIAAALDRHASANKPMRKMRLDTPPATGEIGIVYR